MYTHQNYLNIYCVQSTTLCSDGDGKVCAIIMKSQSTANQMVTR